MSKTSPEDGYEVLARQAGTTHADGCWNWSTRHYDCAIREIRRQQKEIAELRAELDMVKMKKPLTRLERALINALGED